MKRLAFTLPTFRVRTEIDVTIDTHDSSQGEHPIHVLRFGNSYTAELGPRDIEILHEQLGKLLAGDHR